jgi:hypothetical protein
VKQEIKDCIEKVIKAKESIFEVLNEEEKENLQNILKKLIYSKL